MKTEKLLRKFELIENHLNNDFDLQEKKRIDSLTDSEIEIEFGKFISGLCRKRNINNYRQFKEEINRKSFVKSDGHLYSDYIRNNIDLISEDIKKIISQIASENEKD